MEQIKSVKTAKAAGTACGAAAEAALGDTLTSRVLEVLKTMPKGKAVALIGAFWEGFDSSAPTIRGLRRIKVTRSESVRIARGIDAGLQPVDSWAESVKAAPKAEKGKGSGGGRKPRQPGSFPAGTKGAPAPATFGSFPAGTKGAPAPATFGSFPAGTKGAPAPAAKGGRPSMMPDGPVPLSPCVGARQLVAQLVTFCHNHKSKLPTDFLLAVDDLADLAKAQLKS